MRSISSVVIPGLMAACALSRMVRAMWHALREPSICFAVLIGTAHQMQIRAFPVPSFWWSGGKKSSVESMHNTWQ